jgi:hypothetical protein
MKLTLKLAGIVGLAVACNTICWAGSEKLSQELKPEHRRTGRAAETVEVIVQYRVPPPRRTTIE